MVNMMLAPVYLLDGINGNFAEDTDYLIAQKDGYFGRDCSRYHHQCPASLFAVSIFCKETSLHNCCNTILSRIFKHCLNLIFYFFLQYLEGDEYNDQYLYQTDYGSSYANYTNNYSYPDSANEVYQPLTLKGVSDCAKSLTVASIPKKTCNPTTQNMNVQCKHYYVVCCQ